LHDPACCSCTGNERTDRTIVPLCARSHAATGFPGRRRPCRLDKKVETPVDGENVHARTQVEEERDMATARKSSAESRTEAANQDLARQIEVLREEIARLGAEFSRSRERSASAAKQAAADG